MMTKLETFGDQTPWQVIEHRLHVEFDGDGRIVPAQPRVIDSGIGGDPMLKGNAFYWAHNAVETRVRAALNQVTNRWASLYLQEWPAQNGQAIELRIFQPNQDGYPLDNRACAERWVWVVGPKDTAA